MKTLLFYSPTIDQIVSLEEVRSNLFVVLQTMSVGGIRVGFTPDVFFHHFHYIGEL